MSAVFVNPAALKGVGVFPAAAAEYLKLASGHAVKALLFVCANMGKALSVDEIAVGAGLEKAAAGDAVAFWEDKGILCAGDLPVSATVAEEAAPSPAAPAEKPEKPAVIEKPTLPSYDMICKRLAEDETVRVLFSEAQLKLGRTIGTADQSRLLMLLDYYGLPVEVILTVCEYARTHKQTTAQIYSMGIDWAKREIDTLEAADEELKRLEGANALWYAFAVKAGIKLPKLSASQRKFFATWKSEWRMPDDMIMLAFDEMKKNTDSVSFPYMNKILAGWKQAGLDTPEKVAAHEKARALELEKKAAEKRPSTRNKPVKQEEEKASYDMDEAMRRMATQVPKLKKKEDRR